MSLIPIRPPELTFIYFYIVWANKSTIYARISYARLHRGISLKSNCISIGRLQAKALTGRQRQARQPNFINSLRLAHKSLNQMIVGIVQTTCSNAFDRKVLYFHPSFTEIGFYEYNCQKEITCSAIGCVRLCGKLFPKQCSRKWTTANKLQRNFNKHSNILSQNKYIWICRLPRATMFVHGPISHFRDVIMSAMASQITSLTIILLNR